MTIGTLPTFESHFCTVFFPPPPVVAATAVVRVPPPPLVAAAPGPAGRAKRPAKRLADLSTGRLPDASRQSPGQLAADGFQLLEPGTGWQACRTEGPGRLPEPEQLHEAVLAALPAR